MRRLEILCITMACAAVAVLTTKPLSAQRGPAPHEHRIFIDGNLFADRDTSDDDGRRDGLMTAGVGAGIGFVVSSRASARFEIDAPSRHRFALGSGIYGYYDSAIGRTVTGPSDRRGSDRKVTYSGLVGFHPSPGRRVGLTVLAGFGASHESRETINYRAGTTIRMPEFSGTRTELVPIVTYGVDAEIPLTSQVALVPRLRGHLRLGYYFGRGSIFRLGATVRWWF